MIASVSDLEALAAEPEDDHPVLKGWRRKVFGEAAEKLMRGELALAVKGGEIIEIEPA
jgi:ribonuclease D